VGNDRSRKTALYSRYCEERPIVDRVFLNDWLVRRKGKDRPERSGAEIDVAELSRSSEGIDPGATLSPRWNRYLKLLLANCRTSGRT
jgi:hypothetical protein